MKSASSGTRCRQANCRSVPVDSPHHETEETEPTPVPASAAARADLVAAGGSALPALDDDELAARPIVPGGSNSTATSMPGAGAPNNRGRRRRARREMPASGRAPRAREGPDCRSRRTRWQHAAGASPDSASQPARAGWEARGKARTPKPRQGCADLVPRSVLRGLAKEPHVPPRSPQAADALEGAARVHVPGGRAMPRAPRRWPAPGSPPPAHRGTPRRAARKGVLRAQ